MNFVVYSAKMGFQALLHKNLSFHFFSAEIMFL
jgi:hypothetical protein